MAEVTIDVIKNGPYIVKGAVELKDSAGNVYPAEARMALLREPRPFNLHTSRHIMRLMGRSDDKWRKYLFY